MDESYRQKLIHSFSVYFRIPKTEKIGCGCIFGYAKEYGEDIVRIDCLTMDEIIYLPIKETYLTEEEAIFAIARFKKKKKEKYLKKIKTPADLVRFAYNHKTVFSYGTDIDWEARDVVKQKGFELLGINVDRTY